MCLIPTLVRKQCAVGLYSRTIRAKARKQLQIYTIYRILRKICHFFWSIALKILLLHHN